MTTYLHPMLRGSEEIVEGYARVFDREMAAMHHAAGQHPELVERWQRLLTLHRRALLGTTTFPGNLGDEDGRIAFELRLRLLGMAGGTSKLALDAALFGYYSASFGLTRHLLESWIHAAYVGIQPGEARAWFRQYNDAVKDQRQLNERGEKVALSKLKEYFRKHYPADLYMVERIAEVRDAMHKGAHPSGHLLDQLMSGQDNRFIYGPNYRHDFALMALSCGIWATLIVTLEAHRLIPQSVEWQESASAILVEHETVIPSYSSKPHQSDTP